MTDKWQRGEETERGKGTNRLTGFLSSRIPALWTVALSFMATWAYAPTRCFSSLGQVRAMPDSSSRNGVAGPALLYLSRHLGLCSEVRRVLISATKTEQGLFWQLPTPQEEAGRSSQDLTVLLKSWKNYVGKGGDYRSHSIKVCDTGKLIKGINACASFQNWPCIFFFSLNRKGQEERNNYFEYVLRFAFCYL